MTERFAHNMASYPNGPCDYPSFAVACQRRRSRTQFRLSDGVSGSYLFSNGFVGHFLVHEPAKSYAKWHILQLHWVA